MSFMREGYPHEGGEVRSQSPRSEAPPLLAVDTGGTFTDLLLLRGGRLTALKVHSTPEDPARAILEGIGILLGEKEGERFHLIHGSTVATNTLLERKGARVFLVTNSGFEDVLEIGRQNRPQLYALVGHRPPPLVLSADRIGIAGRMDFAGEELTPIESGELSDLPERLHGAEAVAVVLLHSYANTHHEEAVGRGLESLGVPISLSSRILPEFREFERTSTTVANAYIAPRMARYLTRLEESPGAQRIRIMGSSGGTLSLRRALQEPVHTVLSGPAGGVVGALEWGRRCGITDLLSFDMGGTSTDVALLPGKLLHTSEGSVGDLPLAIPILDIHTVGAGGGSIARIDIGEALQVGPESAGAVPGPIAYGKGGSAVTVTDANLWLGRLLTTGLLGGGAKLDPGAVQAPMEALAREAGISADEMAEGILEVVNTSMEGALRVISIERGVDPRDFHIFAFGGAGGLHAAEMAERLGARGVVIPPDPGLLSAFGMLVAPVARDRARTVFIREADEGAEGMIESILGELEAGVLAELEEDGVRIDGVEVSRWVDARYEDQSFELRVPAEGWVEAFHRMHEERFGYRRASVTAVAVTLRVRGEARGSEVPASTATFPSTYGAAPTWRGSAEGSTSVRWKGKWIEALVLRRTELATGDRIVGPAILAEYSSTTWCPPEWKIEIREGGVVVMERVSQEGD